MTDEELSSALAAMRDDPVPADSIGRVRRNVANRGRWLRRWRWAMAAAAAIVLVAVWPGNRPAPERSVPVPSQQAATRTVPPREQRPATIAAATQVKRRSRIRTPPKVWRQMEPAPRNSLGTVYRIETPDPDVVFLLVGD
jgi:hypothetical protein